MTPDQREFVTRSFARIYAAKRDVARRFYADLFARAPALRAIFPDDMGRQQAKLNSTLALVVKEVHRPNVLHPTLEALARSHAWFGAEPEQLPLVGEVLLGALESETPGGLSDGERAAWAAAYEWISGVMRPVLAEEVALRNAAHASGEAPPIPG